MLDDWIEGGGERYAPGTHVKERLRTIQLWLWGTSAWPATAEYVHRNIQLSISNICVIRGCTSSFLLFIKLHEHHKYVYAHTHTHILSLFIVSFHSFPLIFFYCVVGFLSLLLPVYLTPSLSERVRVRERDGRKGRERGDEMRKRWTDEKWRKTACGQRGERRAVRVPLWDIRFCGVRSDFEMLDQLTSWIDMTARTQDWCWHGTAWAHPPPDENWFYRRDGQSLGLKTDRSGASFLKGLETKGIMDLYKYILLFFPLFPKGK